MSKEFISAIGLAVVGCLISFFIANTLTGDIESVSFKTLDNAETADIADPDANIFNADAINPTVEVCVGTCKETENKDDQDDQENDENDEEEDEDADLEDE